MWMGVYNYVSENGHMKIDVQPIIQTGANGWRNYTGSNDGLNDFQKSSKGKT